MQGFAEGLSRLSGGVIGTVGNLFAPKNEEHREGQHRNIEYVDELPSNLYPDLHFSEIIGTQHNKPGPDDEDFLLLESSEIWFLPADWKTALKVRPGRACFVPFFVFDVKTRSVVSAEVLTESEEGLLWQPKTENMHSQYNQIIVCASCTVNQKLIHKLLYSEEHGFSFHSNLALPPQLSPYPPENDDAVTVISPENILPIDITKEEAWDVSVKYKIDKGEYKKAQEEISADRVAYDVHSTRDLKVTTEYFEEHFVVYLPIYFSSFEYNNQVYEVLVSGNKGVVVGNERPIGTGAGGKFIMDKLKSLSNLVTDTVPM